MSGMYDRQDRIEGIENGIKVVVVGAGGIGFHVAKMFALSGVKEIHVFDPDTFEESNLNRIDVPISVLGRNKAEVVKIMIKDMRPEIKVRHYPFPLKEHTFPKGVDWVVDCTDKIVSQQLNFQLAEENNAKYKKIGYDGERVSIDNRVASWDTGSNPDGGYTITPSWCVPAIMVAALGVGSVLKYHESEIGCHIKELYR
jgi:threonine dehydrogenase-like Zn-dependent dehydrogenase